MAARNGNFGAMRAAGFTKVAHQRKPLVKWTIILILAASWVVFGLMGGANLPPSDTVYRTLGALTMSGSFENAARDGNVYHEVARFTGVALTAVGLLFGFSGAVGRSFARLWMMGAAGHVVIAGQGAAALALARSCREAGDAVVLIARDLAPETGWSLRQSGIVLIEGDATHADTLRSARAGHAAHVVALTDDDAQNLRVEAALRAVTPPRKRRQVAAHVAIAAPLLLMEAREMRMLAQRELDGPAGGDKRKARLSGLDPRSFSLEEIAARALLARHGGEILDLAEKQGRERLHLVLFGFAPGAEAIAVRALMSLWSVRFGAPRVTVVVPDAKLAAEQFAARYPQAQAHDVWRADIAFHPFDWTRASLDGRFIDAVDAERGPPAAVIVDTGDDGQNIQLALGLMRTANLRGVWAAPIFLKETTQSEFSRQFAAGDRTEALDAYLQAFGAVEDVATRALVVEGLLDRGAALAQRLYEKNMAGRDVDMRTLEAMGKTWDTVPETYRNANRAAVDSALVKLWDAGWRPARADERHGEVNPPIEPATMDRLAEIEHGRWMAERLLSGWRPGNRDNRLMMHDNITPWSALTEELRARDADQVRAAAHVARALCPKGFVPRAR
ncbi:MAG: NAD-binding protein [Hyphomonadaceae bacterium]|nr:NAD-binding protein [Hyphomonadaceae bacterium]